MLSILPAAALPRSCWRWGLLALAPLLMQLLVLLFGLAILIAIQRSDRPALPDSPLASDAQEVCLRSVNSGAAFAQLLQGLDGIALQGAPVARGELWCAPLRNTDPAQHGKWLPPLLQAAEQRELNVAQIRPLRVKAPRLGPSPLANANVLLATLLSYLMAGALIYRYRALLPSAAVVAWPAALWRIAGVWLLVLLYSAVVSLAFRGEDDFQRYAEVYRQLLDDLGPWLVLPLGVLLIPWLEELVYRKWMLSVLPRAVGVYFGTLLAGALFVAMHRPESLWHAAVLAGLTAALSYVWWRWRSLTLCWTLHASNNLLGLLPLWLGAQPASGG